MKFKVLPLPCIQIMAMRFLLIVLFTLSSVICSGQNYIDLAKLSYQNTPQNQFDSSTAKTNVQELGFTFTLPLVINDKSTFITGGSIDQFSLQLTPTTGQTTFSSYLFKAGFNINHSEKVTGTYLLLPKLASDFKGNLNNNDVQVGALALLKFTKSPTFKYKLGLYYNPDRFGTFFVPLVGLYSKSEKLEVDLTLPVSANANYNLTNDLSLGANFRAVVKTFNLNQAFYGSGTNYIHQSTNEISTYLAYEIKKGLIIKGQVGYSIGRSYRIYDNDDQIDFGISAFRFGDDRIPLNPDFTDGLILRAELIYRFYLEEK